MIVTATELRKNLFAIFDQVSRGETVLVTRGGRPVARVCPAGDNAAQAPADWRAAMTRRPRLTAPAEEAFAPLDDLWADKA